MIEIKNLLSRYNNIFLKEDIKRATVSEVVSDVLGIKVEKDKIVFKNQDVYLNIKPIYKNQIFINQEKIKEDIKAKLGLKEVSLK